MKKISISLVIIVSISLLLLVIKGQGSPLYYQSSSERTTAMGGPFESSNTNSRYALVEAIVDYGTFFFTDEQAKFAAPDLVQYKGNFFSIFTPGVSFIGVPFYMVGKLFGMPQLFTFFSTLLFAILNLYLVTKIGMKLGANKYEAFIGGVLFLFGTNALAYSLSFTQHHASTFFILLSVLNALYKRTWFNNLLLGIIFSAGILMDIPNTYIMLPVVLFAFFKHFQAQEVGEKIKVAFKINSLFFLIGLIPLIFLFGLYNYQLTGSYTKIGQIIGRTDYIESGQLRLQEVEQKEKDPYERKQVFNPRDQLNGLYVLLVSNERGVFYYSPVLLIGLFGLWVAYRKKENRSSVILVLSVVLVCVVSYSMFGDPWGGWSFGARYLIPASALACIGVGVVIQKYKKNVIFIFIFSTLVVYSVSVSSLGAMTTSAIPPKVEAVNLPEPIPYTYEYNLRLVEENRSSALLYNLFFYNYIFFRVYLAWYIVAVSSFISVLYILTLRDKNK